MPGWLTDIFRSFFFFIDGIIYKFIDTVYALFLEIANTSIFTEDMINEFAGKVYALVGIFMLFKVSFSLLTYIINPDEFADKSKGMGKLIKNIITSLMLFILVPIIFREAMDIQRIILKDDIIPRIFSTSTSADISVSSQDPSMGNQMAVITFKAFYEIDGNYDLQGIFNTDVNQRDSSDNYIVKYTYLISSAVGVVLLLILISFCFDIAVRSVKLGFLRLIAPVPIMTRIDPKKGSELFNKWIKTCTSTYLDLFMRLAAIFFAIYIIKAVTTSAGFVDAVTGDPIEVSKFAIVFIILGALMFAKQLPKLIEDLLGIKLSGNFSLNPAKKLAEVPIAGKLAAAGVGAIDSGIHGNGWIAGAKRNWNNVSWGGDGKNSVLQTADRKMRKEINEKRDNARTRYEGMKEFDDMHDQWQQGDEARQRIDGISTLPHHGADWAKNFDGVNSSAYEAVYRNSEFIASLMHLDKSDEEAKNLSQAYSKAQIEGFSAPVTVNGTTYTTLDDLIAANEKAAKVKAGAEKVHDTMRKKYANDAKMQDAIKMRKNNPSDPTSL